MRLEFTQIKSKIKQEIKAEDGEGSIKQEPDMDIKQEENDQGIPKVKLVIRSDGQNFSSSAINGDQQSDESMETSDTGNTSVENSNLFGDSGIFHVKQEPVDVSDTSANSGLWNNNQGAFKNFVNVDDNETGSNSYSRQNSMDVDSLREKYPSNVSNSCPNSVVSDISNQDSFDVTMTDSSSRPTEKDNRLFEGGEDDRVSIGSGTEDSDSDGDSDTDDESQQVHSKHSTMQSANNDNFVPSNTSYNDGLFGTSFQDGVKQSEFSDIGTDFYNNSMFANDKPFAAQNEVYDTSLDSTLLSQDMRTSQVNQGQGVDASPADSFGQQLSVTQYENISSPEADDSFSKIISGHKMDSSYSIGIHDQNQPQTSGSQASSSYPTAQSYPPSQLHRNKSNLSADMLEDDGTPTTVYSSDDSDKEPDQEEDVNKARMQNAIDSIISLNQDSSPYPMSQSSDYFGPGSYKASEGGVTSQETSSQECSEDEDQGEEPEGEESNIDDDLDAAVNSILM